MSKRIRSLAIALGACGIVACMLLPCSPAQEKSGGQSKKSTAAASAAAANDLTAGKMPAATSSSKSDAASSSKGDESATEKKVAEKSASVKNSAVKAEAATKPTSNPLRLPRYFSGIVDQQQREAIYAIQLEYRSKISELEEELARVRQDELSALEGVLTDSQRKLLAQKRSQMQDAAKAKKSAAETADDTTE